MELTPHKLTDYVLLPVQSEDLVDQIFIFVTMGSSGFYTKLPLYQGKCSFLKYYQINIRSEPILFQLVTFQCPVEICMSLRHRRFTGLKIFFSFKSVNYFGSMLVNVVRFKEK